MNNYKLLESIGAVDDELLQECETATFARKSVAFKVLLVAAIIAMLSVTALAVQQFLFTDVSGGELQPAEFKIYVTNSDWKVEQIGTKPGYLVNATIETFDDVPMKLLYPYLPAIPENWVCSGASNGKYDGEIGVFGVEWTYAQDGKEYQVFYRQESAHFYNAREAKTIWWLDHLPEDVTVTGRATTILDVKVYRVEISGSADRNWYNYDRSLIFWSDGYSIFQLDVPQYWDENRIFELMCSLTLQADIEAALSNLN